MNGTKFKDKEQTFVAEPTPNAHLVQVSVADVLNQSQSEQPTTPGAQRYVPSLQDVVPENAEPGASSGNYSSTATDVSAQSTYEQAIPSSDSRKRPASVCDFITTKKKTQKNRYPCVVSGIELSYAKKLRLHVQ